MRIDSARMPGFECAAVVWVAIAAVALAGCAVADSTASNGRRPGHGQRERCGGAQAELTAASGAFCEASEDYVVALDRYGDVLNDTAPTVGDVKEAGADLAEPRENAFDGAEAAVEAQQALVVAQQELADARAALAEAEAGPSGTPADAAAEQPTAHPLAPPRPSSGSSRLSRSSLPRRTRDRPDPVGGRIRAVQQRRRRARTGLAAAVRRCRVPAR